MFFYLSLFYTKLTFCYIDYLRKLHMRKRYFEDVSHKQQFFLKDFPEMFVGLYMQKLRFT